MMFVLWMALASLQQAPVGQRPYGEAYMKGDELLVATTPADATAVFQRVCLVPFPDEAAFRAAVAHDAAGLTVAAQDEVGELASTGKVQPARGGLWHADRYNVRYFAAGSLAPISPQPQCKLSARLADAPDARQLATNVAASLKFVGGHELIVGTHARTYWDIAQPTGPRWRVLLKSEAGPQGNFMVLTLLKLKD